VTQSVAAPGDTNPSDATENDKRTTNNGRNISTTMRQKAVVAILLKHRQN